MAGGLRKETLLTTATVTVKRAVYELPLVARVPDELPEAAADGPLLLHHAEWFCKLRWLVVAARPMRVHPRAAVYHLRRRAL